MQRICATPRPGACRGTALSDGRRTPADIVDALRANRHVRLRHAYAQRPEWLDIHPQRHHPAANARYAMTPAHWIRRAHATPAGISSRAYLHHLQRINEFSGAHLNTLHNLSSTRIDAGLREAISAGRLSEHVDGLRLGQAQPC